MMKKLNRIEFSTLRSGYMCSKLNTDYFSRDLTALFRNASLSSSSMEVVSEYFNLLTKISSRRLVTISPVERESLVENG